MDLNIWSFELICLKKLEKYTIKFSKYFLKGKIEHKKVNKLTSKKICT
jgi:hypothetical protein